MSMRKSKQFKLLEKIIADFMILQGELPMPVIKKLSKDINLLFRLSKNKRDLARMILNEVVLSDSEIVFLLKICFKKESEF